MPKGLSKPVYSIELTWPYAELNPNRKPHWKKLANSKAAYKNECYIMALDQGVPEIEERDLEITYIFYEPQDRATGQRDLDNMHASMKSGQDGIFLALKIDDRLVKEARIKMARSSTKKGNVIFQLRYLKKKSKKRQNPKGG